MKFYLLSTLATLFLATNGHVHPGHRSPLALKETMDVANENTWNSVMPNIRAEITIDDAAWVAGKVYQLNCNAWNGPTAPVEYNVHFMSKTGNLGYYYVKTGNKVSEFTADQAGLVASKHQVLERENDPKNPVYLLIKPSGPDTFSCRIEVPSKKHPYSAFSNEVVQTGKKSVEVKPSDIGVAPWPTAEDIEIEIPWGRSAH